MGVQVSPSLPEVGTRNSLDRSDKAVATRQVVGVPGALGAYYFTSTRENTMSHGHTKHSMQYPQRTQELSDRCVRLYEFDDVLEHLEEEALEMLLALKRVRRRREPLENFAEELVDLRIEINTTLTGLNEPEMVDRLEHQKLNKFQGALDQAQADFLRTGKKVQRYHSILELPDGT